MKKGDLSLKDGKDEGERISDKVKFPKHLCNEPLLFVEEGENRGEGFIHLLVGGIQCFLSLGDECVRGNTCAL